MAHLITNFRRQYCMKLMVAVWLSRQLIEGEAMTIKFHCIYNYHETTFFFIQLDQLAKPI